MQVHVWAKHQFDRFMAKKGITDKNVGSYDKICFISINDTTGTNAVPYFKDNTNVKVLYFDDVEEDIEVPVIDGTNTFVKAKAFTIEQGQELLSFIDRNKDKETCIVHCSAGISRSGAVGTFINDYFKEDYFEFKKINPHIHPNGKVLRTLKALAILHGKY